MPALSTRQSAAVLQVRRNVNTTLHGLPGALLFIR
jgi:hypothetical protein